MTSPPPPPPTATGPSFSGRPRTNTRVDAAPPVPAAAPLSNVTEVDEDALTADFAAELARGMESLMREIAAGVPPAAGDAVPDDAALKAAWEAMLVEGMDGMAIPGLAAAAPAPPPAPAHPADFQSKIQQAMGKLREGEEGLQDASGSGTAPDSLETLLAQLNELGAAGGAGGDGDPDEAELAGFLENMMGELMSKDVLYEPLTELAEKFPPYLATPQTPPLAAADRTRYEAQLARVRAILAIFDTPAFDDADPVARERVVALMAEMQSFGSPPTELMGPLPPGLGALGGEEGCVVA
ncbi:Pex19 protein [Mycena vulgaris]|nr:Pex19 protein [Mycena vulgaris]